MGIRDEIEDEINDESMDNSAINSSKKALSKKMVVACYVLSLFLFMFIMNGFAIFIADIINNIRDTEPDKDIGRIHVISTLAIIYFYGNFMFRLGDHYRSSEKNEIGTAVTNFPNPFYDPSFTKAPLALKKQYNELSKQYTIQNKFLEKSLDKNMKLAEALVNFESKLRVLVRHNDNSNRLMKSFNFLYGRKEHDFQEKMLRQILSECITVLEKDQSDKSISLFHLNDDNELVIRESVRINAESVAKRSFKKGDGFAGYIWELGHSEIVNEIKANDDRFLDGGLTATPIGSIVGFPLKTDGNILGVLCLQSEVANGFNEADLRTIEFYARLCTFILLYDKIDNNKGK